MAVGVTDTIAEIGEAVVFTPVQKQFIETQLQAMIARLLWNTEGYFKIYNFSDSVVLKAITIAKQ